MFTQASLVTARKFLYLQDWVNFTLMESALILLLFILFGVRINEYKYKTYLYNSLRMEIMIH